MNTSTLRLQSGVASSYLRLTAGVSILSTRPAIRTKHGFGENHVDT